MKVKEILKYVLSAAIAGVLLYFSFREVKWDDFVTGLKDCRWGYVMLSMVAGVLAFWFRGLRWRRLLLPVDPGTSRLTAFNAVNIGYLANFVIPRIGEFVRCGVVSRNSAGRKASYEKVLGTVVLERAWDLVSMLLLLVVLLVLWPVPLPVSHCGVCVTAMFSAGRCGPCSGDCGKEWPAA